MNGVIVGIVLGVLIGNGIRLIYWLITGRDIKILKGAEEVERLQNEIKRIQSKPTVRGER